MRIFFLVVVFFCFPAAQAQTQMMFSDTSRIGKPYSKDPHVIKFKGKYLMYYSIPRAKDHPVWNLGIAESKNLVDWDKVGEIAPAPDADYEQNGLFAPCALVRDGKVHLFYQINRQKKRFTDAICHAVSDDGIRFERNATNPIFHPTGDWTYGRAIDAEVIEFRGKYFLYFATRDPSLEIQVLGVATAPADTDFNREDWTQTTDSAILYPQLPWESKCIEAPSIIRRGDKLYMFYAGAYNNHPQQIGVAVSNDGVVWKCLFDKPFLSNGKPGEWNSCESGHPHIFTDLDGRTYLFFQGNNDMGKTWFISNKEVFWKRDYPTFTK